MKVHVTKVQFENYIEFPDRPLKLVIHKTENFTVYYYYLDDEVIAWCEKRPGSRRRDYVVSMPIQDYTSASN